MPSDGNRVGINHSSICGFHLSAGESDVGNLRVRAGVRTSGEVDPDRHAKVREPFIQFGSDFIQSILGFDRRKIAVGVSGAGCLVSAEGFRVQRIPGKYFLLPEIPELIFWDVQDDQMVGVSGVGLPFPYFADNSMILRKSGAGRTPPVTLRPA